MSTYVDFDGLFTRTREGVKITRYISYATRVLRAFRTSRHNITWEEVTLAPFPPPLGPILQKKHNVTYIVVNTLRNSEHTTCARHTHTHARTVNECKRLVVFLKKKKEGNRRNPFVFKRRRYTRGRFLRVHGEWWVGHVCLLRRRNNGVGRRREREQLFPKRAA